MEEDSTPHYMVELVLENRPVLVVGGGQVARRKIEGLLACRAVVTVAAPELEAGVADLAGRGEIVAREVGFAPELLAGPPVPFLVFAATATAAMNREVAGLCRERGILCNSADDPGSSDFLVPAMIRRGRVGIGVGTGGLSPALSRVLKERIDAWLEPGWGGLAMAFGAWRARVAERVPAGEARQRFWRAAARDAVADGGLERDGHDGWFEVRLRDAGWG
ncbi:MAG: bifunctional precorrin-2 dehydrogenase/sirohydrochlorin ferrochelatase [Magnetococcales bacterium]|nr:bifunctional precorrin-2 dehydrogenase/sirohydrochlorin ferrochelatase [Magnetococcales bacterium]